jgi:hypothetical protein
MLLSIVLPRHKTIAGAWGGLALKTIADKLDDDGLRALSLLWKYTGKLAGAAYEFSQKRIPASRSFAAWKSIHGTWLLPPCPQ